MSKKKAITQTIFWSTGFSVSLFLYIKYLEVEYEYPRRFFCVTCPCLPSPSYIRSLENGMNFNMFMVMDFWSMLMILMIFGSKNYHHHPTYLFTFHVSRFLFTTANYSNSKMVTRILKPMFRELCGFGGQCSDENILPHTTVALLYLIFSTAMFINFCISIFLLYTYDPLQTERTPTITRARHRVTHHRPLLRRDFISPSTPPLFRDRSPSPPPPAKQSRVTVANTQLTKYHRLDSSDSFSREAPVKRPVPLTLPKMPMQSIF